MRWMRWGPADLAAADTALVDRVIALILEQQREAADPDDVEVG